MAILSYMGTPRYAVQSSADQEIVAELLPQTHPGPFRQSEWDEFLIGAKTDANPTGKIVYRPDEWANAPTASLRNILHEFEEGLEHARLLAERDMAAGAAKTTGLKNAEGYLYIEEWQVGLKRVTFRVTWEGLDGTPAPLEEDVCVTGAQNEYCQVAYLHSEANYRQGP
jgi:hypothetical protein